MKIILKLLIIFISIVSFIAVFCYLMADNIAVQLSFFSLVLVFNLIRLKLIRFFAEIKIFLPFVISMLVVYFLIGLVGLRLFSVQQDWQQNILFWINYGLLRCLMFLNTVLILQFLLSFIQIDELLRIPLPVKYMKFLILAKTLYSLAFENIRTMELHLHLLPEFQTGKKRFRDWFHLKLQLTLCVFLLLLNESKIRGELIDNRIRFCYFDNQKKR